MAQPPLGLKEALDQKGNCLISDTSLNSLMPPNVKKMSNKYKMMCGCEICILIKGMQNDLNAYRLLLLRKFENKNGKKAKIKAKAYKKYAYDNDEHLYVHPKKSIVMYSMSPC